MSSSSRGLRLRIARIGWLNLVYFVFLVTCPVLTIVVFNSGMPYSIPAGLMLWILLLGIATYFGARRSPSRQTTLGIAISVMCLLGTVFTGVGILPVRHFPVWILAAIPPPYVAGLLFWVLRTGAAPEVPSESTPDQCWSMGDIYNNPNDPALFVPKHVGAGYTINIGNPTGQ